MTLFSKSVLSLLVSSIFSISALAANYAKGDIVLTSTEAGVFKSVVLEVRDNVYKTTVTANRFVGADLLAAYVPLPGMTVQSLQDKVTFSDGALMSIGDEALLEIAGVPQKVRILDITSNGFVSTTQVDTYFKISELAPIVKAALPAEVPAAPGKANFPDKM